MIYLHASVEMKSVIVKINKNSQKAKAREVTDRRSKTKNLEDG
jgi:hypothetical protein